jgi:hypothetical protein
LPAARPVHGPLDDDRHAVDRFDERPELLVRQLGTKAFRDKVKRLFASTVYSWVMGVALWRRNGSRVGSARVVCVRRDASVSTSP